MTPESAVAYGTATMLFATPATVIASGLLQTWMNNRTARESRNATKTASEKLEVSAAKVAAEVETVRVVHATTEHKIDALIPAVAQVHTLVNNNLTQALTRADLAFAESQDLKRQVAELMEQVRELKADRDKKRVRS